MKLEKIIAITATLILTNLALGQSNDSYNKVVRTEKGKDVQKQYTEESYYEGTYKELLIETEWTRRYNSSNQLVEEEATITPDKELHILKHKNKVFYHRNSNGEIDFRAVYRDGNFFEECNGSYENREISMLDKEGKCTQEIRYHDNDEDGYYEQRVDIPVINGPDWDPTKQEQFKVTFDLDKDGVFEPKNK